MKVLIVDDEKTIAITLHDALKEKGHEVTAIADGRRALDLVKEQDFEAVILDLKLPGLDGMEVLKQAKAIKPELPIVIITGYGTVQSAVEAVKIGAYDYIQKPFLNEEIILLLDRLQTYQNLRRAYDELKQESQEKVGFGHIIGKSKKMQAVYELIESVANSDCSVLIEGESGTGKELVAEAIHSRSRRREFPLVKMSCAVFPENLIESELFGHEKGAFTDAKTQKIGRFELADKGTVFLDDIDDMSPQTQVKLLRVLQEHEFERIGGIKTIKVDIRIVVATKVDLLAKVKAGLFREDLFYRLNVVTIKLPPLRERTEDIPLLVDHFIKKYGRGKEYKVDPEAYLALESYPWPGNVRELENAVERAIALAEDNILTKQHLLKPSVAELDQTKTQELLSLEEYLNQAEVNYLKKLREITKGNKGKMAEILQIARKTLWEKLKKYGLE